MGWGDSVVDGGEQRVAVDGFAEIAAGAKPQRARPVFDGVVSGDDDDWHARMMARECSLYVEAADFGHMQIEHDTSRLVVIE